MKKLGFLFLNVLSLSLFSQVGINTTSPKGILHIQNLPNKDLGLVMPIVDSAAITKTPSGSTAIEATAVYDSLQQCIRVRTASAWSSCLVDKSSVIDIINSQTFAGYWISPAYSDENDRFMHRKFAGGFYSTVFQSSADNNYIDGAGLSNYLGTGSPAQTINPAKKLMNKDVLTVANSFNSQVLITTAGEVYVAGYNAYGQLGDGTTTDIATWKKITISGLQSGELPIQIAKGYVNTCILTNKGNVYAAGYNVDGQTGLGTVVGNTLTFTKIPTLSNITSIWGGNEYDIYYMFTAINSAGKVFVWGNNYYQGPFGATDTTVSTPTDITSYFSAATSGGATVKKFMVANLHTIALMSDGSLWGSTTSGQSNARIGLGAGTSTINTLRSLTTAVGFSSGEKIIDFDIDYEGSVVITNNYIYYTGYNYSAKFGAGIESWINSWTKNNTPIFDGKIKLTNVDLSRVNMILSTGSGSLEGGGRLIVSGYNSVYYNIGTQTTAGGNTTSSVWAKF